MAGDPERRMGKVMFEVLSKAARYSDVLRIRHFVCDFGRSRTTTKGDFLLKRNALWLPEEKIRRLTDKQTAYGWRIDYDCRRDCVSLKLEPAWHLVERYYTLAPNLLAFCVCTYVMTVRDTFAKCKCCSIYVAKYR